MQHIKGKGQARQEELRKLVITQVTTTTSYTDAKQILETGERNLRELHLLYLR